MRWMVALASLLALPLGACAGSDTGSQSTTTTSTGTDFSLAELTPLLVRGGPDVVPVRGSDGRYHLLWEVPVQNATSLPLTVTDVEVDGDGTAVLSLGADQVADVVEVIGTRKAAAAAVGPAEAAYIFLTASFDSLDQVPSELTHSVTVTSDKLPKPITVTGGQVAVDARAVVPKLGPPIEAGKNYVAADSCCSSTRHIRAGLPVDNGYWYVQRFAIDWEELNDSGQFVVGDPSKPENYVVYGKNALTVADGTVVHILDGLDDQVPGELPGTSIPLDEADGNNVVIDIGDGLYAFYGHLQKGSIQVKVGDKVSRGDVLARVGNTGNSSAPHLHFHVLDGPSNFTANGRPYVIDSFVTTGRGESTDTFDAVENTEQPFTIVPIDGPGERTNELPLDLWIINFP